MKSKLIYIFSFVLISIISLMFTNHAYALCTASGGDWTEIYFCSTNGTGTTWGVSYDYLFADGRYFPAKTVYASINGSGYQCPSGTDQYAYVGIPSLSTSYHPQSGDKVKWYTACVDPTINFQPTTQNFCRYGEGIFYTQSIDVSCKNQKNEKYAGCYNMPSFTTLGTVSPTAQCPYSRSRTSYCTKGGCTAYPQSCAPSYCGGSGSCTYYQKNCNGPAQSDCNNKTGATGCSYSTTSYSTNCGGNNISGTSMCSSYSKSCAPGAPSVTLSAICNGINPNIRVNYTSNAGSKGNSNYDLRWRATGASSWNNVCSPPAAGSGYDYVITTSALDDATTYQVQVRQHTISGINGPTNFGSATVTTPTCNPTYVISGTVFLDNGSGGGTAGDGIRNGTEPVYTGGATLTIKNTSTGSVTTSASNGSGNYSSSKKNGTYTISVSASGYHATTPTKTITVSGANINNVNFGIMSDVTANAWYQSVGGDVRDDNGISVSLPPGQYFSASQATPIMDGGVVFTSQPSASFGSGTPNQNNWLAKNNLFSPLPPGIKTSYAYINANIQKLGTTITSISAFPSSLTSGNYTYKSSGDLSIEAGTDFNFPANGTYIFLIDGNLDIHRNLIIPPTSVVIFIVSKDITFGSEPTRIDGIYSSDQGLSFESLSPDPDTQLIIQGSIIGNAALQTDIPFDNQRDLGGAANATTPSVKVIFRPDFVLHVPDIIKKPSYSVSEIAPVGGN